MTTAEVEALRADAVQRLAVLRDREAALRVDIDDPLVCSEWTTIRSEIRSAEAVLEDESA